MTYGYVCPCGFEISDPDEQTLARKAWRHARTCEHEEHVAARAEDKTYGHRDHFRFEE